MSAHCQSARARDESGFAGDRFAIISAHPSAGSPESSPVSIQSPLDAPGRAGNCSQASRRPRRLEGEGQTVNFSYPKSRAAKASSPPSAASEPASEANRFAPPLRARIRASLMKSGVRIPAIVAFHIREQQALIDSNRSSAAARADLERAVFILMEKARDENWSQRKLAKKVGFCPRTWRRIRESRVNPAVWLPKLRPALAKLHGENATALSALVT